MGKQGNEADGFSMVELVVVLALSMVVAAIAIPSAQNLVRTYRLLGDTAALSSQLSLARMRAAANFANGQLAFNTSASTYQAKLCTSGCSTAGNWIIDGPLLRLSPGMSFSYGSISAAAQPQSSIAQTSPVIFNSRGYPVDNAGAATGNNAIYLTDGQGNYRAITVYADGRIATWRYQASGWRVVK
ncbi:MAG: prepilin-type N-terminal cleavage/methylation domain-containing protein [Acidobacteriia bacterium]|nr:prepilin-type N-terminal cleavage/methylation domain-containing protein [Terriglobia bacterium]